VAEAPSNWPAGGIAADDDRDALAPTSGRDKDGPGHSPDDDNTSDPTTVIAGDVSQRATPKTTSIDWDAATAAALSDETEPLGTTLNPRAVSGSTADRLLEDIIREIVGDAAADTVSSLQPSHIDPETYTAAPAAQVGSTSQSESTASEYTPPTASTATPESEGYNADGKDDVAAAEAMDHRTAPARAEVSIVTGPADGEPLRSRTTESNTFLAAALSDTTAHADDASASEPPQQQAAPDEALAAPTAVEGASIDRVVVEWQSQETGEDAAPAATGVNGTAKAVFTMESSRISATHSAAVNAAAGHPADAEHVDVTSDDASDVLRSSPPVASPDVHQVTVDDDGSLDSDVPEPTDVDAHNPQPLNASWPTEASIAATATGEGIDVSRETVVRAATPVSRETVIEYGGTPLADQLADETRRRLALDEAVLPIPPSTRIITISNQKGGVGKTTTAVNLAAALARSGARVLVVDLDPQGNASTALGVDHRSEQQSVYDVLVADLPLAEVIRPSTEHDRLDCVPATIHLAGAEIELVSLVAREQRLRRALDNHLASMERPYDYVFIDCPPSLGLLTINAFVAAREVLIPIQCEYYALEGLSQLLSNIELIEKHLNPELRLTTILLTMYDSRTNLAQQVAQEVRDHFPTQTLKTIIPRSVRVSEAPSYGQSVISYDFGSTGSLSYREAAAEIARRSVSNPKEHTHGN